MIGIATKVQTEAFVARSSATLLQTAFQRKPDVKRVDICDQIKQLLLILVHHLLSVTLRLIFRRVVIFFFEIKKNMIARKDLVSSELQFCVCVLAFIAPFAFGRHHPTKTECRTT